MKFFKIDCDKKRHRNRDKKEREREKDLSINKSEFNLADAVYHYDIAVSVKAPLCKRVSFSQYV